MTLSTIVGLILGAGILFPLAVTLMVGVWFMMFDMLRMIFR